MKAVAADHRDHRRPGAEAGAGRVPGPGRGPDMQKLLRAARRAATRSTGSAVVVAGRHRWPTTSTRLRAPGRRRGHPGGARHRPGRHPRQLALTPEQPGSRGTWPATSSGPSTTRRRTEGCQVGDRIRLVIERRPPRRRRRPPSRPTPDLIDRRGAGHRAARPREAAGRRHAITARPSRRNHRRLRHPPRHHRPTSAPTRLGCAEPATTRLRTEAGSGARPIGGRSKSAPGGSRGCVAERCSASGLLRERAEPSWRSAAFLAGAAFLTGARRRPTGRPSWPGPLPWPGPVRPSWPAPVPSWRGRLLGRAAARLLAGAFLAGAAFLASALPATGATAPRRRSMAATMVRRFLPATSVSRTCASSRPRAGRATPMISLARPGQS